MSGLLGAAADLPGSLCYCAVMPWNHESDRDWALPYAYAVAAGISIALVLSLMGVWLHR